LPVELQQQPTVSFAKVSGADLLEFVDYWRREYSGMGTKAEDE
jgi:hypothetical protein